MGIPQLQVSRSHVATFWGRSGTFWMEGEGCKLLVCILSKKIIWFESYWLVISFGSTDNRVFRQWIPSWKELERLMLLITVSHGSSRSTATSTNVFDLCRVLCLFHFNCQKRKTGGFLPPPGASKSYSRKTLTWCHPNSNWDSKICTYWSDWMQTQSSNCQAVDAVIR